MSRGALSAKTIYELHKDISASSISIVDIVEAALGRTRRLGKEMNYFISVGGEEALEWAKRLEEEARKGKIRSPLHGVPISLKDNIAAERYPLTNGAPYMKREGVDNAEITSRLLDAGAVIIGKNNMHELALGVTNINPHYGASRNPWGKDRITGGSSGGSAGSVAAGIVYGSIGTDTGGSIRIPSSLCGVVGLKPTYSLVSLKGVTPLAWSLDHAGPITRSVKDAAILLSILTGKDYHSNIDESPSRYKLGVLREFIEDADDRVKSGFWEAAHFLERIGGEIVEVKLPHKNRIRAASTTITLSEAALYHQETLKKHGASMGEDVAHLLKHGLSTPATEYVKALQLKNLITREFMTILSRIDLLASPTTAIQAPKIEDANTIEIRLKLLAFTALHNLTGAPAITLPTPKTVNGLPVGIQLIAGHNREATLLRIARSYEVEAKTLNIKPPNTL
jgi:aspartyl-tRNA(Asn)/glutamyl-tRNA(Gln) amidotransferase subunit A